MEKKYSIKNKEVVSNSRHNAETTAMFKKKDKPRSFALAVLFTTIKVLVVVVILLGVTGVGLVLGIAKAYIDTTPMLDLAALTDSSKTSYVYDNAGNVICTYAGSEYRDWASIEEIPDMLKNAVIAIEDVRFRDHSGLDYKRLVSAVINTFRNEDTHGGSTITQQLIKNTILSNVQSYKRKIQEAYLALELESVSDKDSILEAYLNEIYFGDQNYGIKAAAKDYFGKELNELTIRECAMLAGMIQKPNGYNPRLNTYVRIDSETGENQMKRTDDRTDTVIRAMYDAGFISLEQRDKAYEEKVEILEESTKTQAYDHAYFIEYAIYDVETHLLKQRGLADTKANRNIIDTEIRTGGYHIYLTLDPDIQNIVEYEIENYSNYPSLVNSSAAVRREENADGTVTEIIEPQAAAVVMDHNTGNIVALVGGRTKPTAQKQWNRAYMSKLEVGSSIKPLTVYGPALDKGLSPATPVYNIPAAIKGWNTPAGYPSIASSTDIVSMRKGIRSSLNVVAARLLMYEVGLNNSADYLKKMGISESQINKDGPGLALGTTGITPVQMAGAYSTIANDGVYQEPLAFTKVVDSDGRIILDANQVREVHRVYKSTTAWLLTSMMKDVVESGTGTRANMHGITEAGKTGTNSDYSSVCFSGFTGYYTATVWIGHDYPENKLANRATGGQYAAPLWKNFMARIHEGLEDKEIQDTTPESLGLVRRTVCSVSGKFATDACYNDKTHSPITDWFDPDNLPNEYCKMHATYEVCKESGLIATNACPEKETVSVVVIPSDSPLRYFRDNIFTHSIVGELMKCNIHGGGDVTTPTDSPDPSDDNSPSPTHDPNETPEPTKNPKEIEKEANKVIGKVEAYLEKENDLDDTQRAELKNLIMSIKVYIKAERYDKAETYIETLKNRFEEYTGQRI